MMSYIVIGSILSPDAWDWTDKNTLQSQPQLLIHCHQAVDTSCMISYTLCVLIGHSKNQQVPSVSQEAKHYAFSL